MFCQNTEIFNNQVGKHWRRFREKNGYKNKDFSCFGSFSDFVLFNIVYSNSDNTQKSYPVTSIRFCSTVAVRKSSAVYLLSLDCGLINLVQTLHGEVSKLKKPKK